MGRWTQYDDDSYRLPDGVTRVGYDADEARYTFQDQDGQLYQGKPGQEYGVLEPIGSPTSRHDLFDAEQLSPMDIESPDSRLNVFDTERQSPRVSVDTKIAPRTFEEFLPPSAITSPGPLSENATRGHWDTPVRSAPLSESPQHNHSRSRFVNAVRRTTMPKMQEVVKRSLTMARKSRGKGSEPEHNRLLPDHDQVRELSVSVAESSSSPSSNPSMSIGGNVARSATTASNFSRTSAQTAVSGTSTLTPISTNTAMNVRRSSSSASSH